MWTVQENQHDNGKLEFEDGTGDVNFVITKIEIIERITLFRNSSMCTFIPLISDIQIS